MSADVLDVLILALAWLVYQLALVIRDDRASRRAHQRTMAKLTGGQP